MLLISALSRGRRISVNFDQPSLWNELQDSQGYTVKIKKQTKTIKQKGKKKSQAAIVYSSNPNTQ